MGNVLIDGGTLKTEEGVQTDRNIKIGAAGATVDVNGTANVTELSGLIDGAGSLVKTGDGTLKVVLNSENYQKAAGEIA